MQEWKDVKGYEGLYQVSNTGKVRSLSHFAKNGSNSMRITIGRELAPYRMPNGYYQVQLSRGNHREKAYIHRLVAEAFIANNLSLPEVNHKDGDKSNNAINNLEWVSRRDNQIHMIKSGLTKRTCPVLCIETGKLYPSYSAAEKETGISRKTIKRSCEGKNVKDSSIHWRAMV